MAAYCIPVYTGFYTHTGCVTSQAPEYADPNVDVGCKRLSFVIKKSIHSFLWQTGGEMEQVTRFSTFSVHIFCVFRGDLDIKEKIQRNCCSESIDAYQAYLPNLFTVCLSLLFLFLWPTNIISLIFSHANHNIWIIMGEKTPDGKKKRDFNTLKSRLCLNCLATRAAHC